jgi:hypothetical protein
MNTCPATRNGAPCSLEHGHDRAHFAAESGESWPTDAWPTGRAWVTLADMRATVCPVRAVPLRASAAAVAARTHTEAAQVQRDAAHAQRRAMGRVSGDPDDVSFWRDSMRSAAVEADAQALAHEQAAARWSARVSA